MAFRRFSILFTLACGLSLAACGSERKTPTKANGENTAALCDDGTDNDDDGLIDCADPGCTMYCGAQEVCDDGVDNDDDNLTDCADPDCGLPQGCGPEDTDAFCGDGRDNDADGYADCFDVGCRESAEVDYCGSENTDDLCRDHVDNDGDAQTDCDDADCAHTAPCSSTEEENDAARCAERRDNDADGYTDCADSDCVEAGVAGCADSETGLCADNIDNDGDLLKDCADTADCGGDPACQSVTPENTAVLCSNGSDDDGDGDGDGLVDCADPDCKEQPVCATTESSEPFCADDFDNGPGMRRHHALHRHQRDELRQRPGRRR